MSFNLLFEMAAAIGTQRMIVLCEHYLWVTDTQNAERVREALGPSAASLSPVASASGGGGVLDGSGAVIPPAWRSQLDRGSRWSDAGTVTPQRPASRETVCPGAPVRLRLPFQSPTLCSSPEASSPPPFQLPEDSGLCAVGNSFDRDYPEVVRRLEERDYSSLSHGQLLAELRALAPRHPLLCPLHNCRAPGGPALGYSRNSSGNYSMYAPSCIGCSVGEAEREEAEGATE